MIRVTATVTLARPRVSRYSLTVRRIASGLLVALVVLSATETSYVFLRCRFTGAVMPPGCCPEAGSRLPDRTPVLAGDSCCDRGSVDVSRVPSEVARVTTADLGLIACATIALPEAVTSSAIRLTRSPATRPPPWRASLTLLKSSFLI